MIIQIRGTLQPLTNDGTTIDINPSNPSQEMSIKGIGIKIIPGDKQIIVSTNLDVGDDIYNFLLNPTPETVDEAILSNGMKNLRTMAQRIVRYLKYFYGIHQVDDNDEFVRFKEKYEWSDESNLWKIIPEFPKIGWRPAGLTYVLDDNLLGWMPYLIENDIEPFFGFTHLHKAFHETNTRHQWINATIAAELGFKEFLSLYKPDLEPLLHYLPSPPANKLYSSILKEYSGTESPVYKSIAKAVEKRNSLVHKPHQPRPSIKETNIYLHEVEVALLHLYTILYPDNSFFEYLLKSSLGRLEYIKQDGAVLTPQVKSS